MKRGIYRKILFVVIMSTLLIFYFWICFFQMRFGDDILFPFYKGFQHYLDGASWIPEEKVETLGQAFIQYKEYYLTFSGRITALFQGYLFNKLGEGIVSVISALIYVGTIIVVCRLGMGNWKKVIRVPVLLLFVSLYMYQLTPTGTYICMWTFVCQYAVPVISILVYYLLVCNAYKEKLSFRKEMAIFALGLWCGWSHECLGAFAILLVSVRGICEIYINRAMTWKKMWINVGLYIGYLIVLAAPGNYRRMLLSHDESRISVDIMSKFKISCYEHLVSSGILNKQESWILALFGLFVIWSYIKNRNSILKYVKDNLEWIVLIFISIPVWAVFAPPVPQYGLQLWKAASVVLLLKAIDTDVLKEKYWNLLGIGALVMIVLYNVGWLGDLTRTTIQRKSQISEAIEKGEEVVYVDKYPESTNNYLTLYNYANQQEFISEYAKKYYGIRIYIENENP